jgi:hypothetical protein
MFNEAEILWEDVLGTNLTHFQILEKPIAIVKRS